MKKRHPRLKFKAELETKEDKFKAVYTAVLILLNNGYNQNNIKLAMLSKVSGVSRPWIYKYLGKDIKKILIATGDFYFESMVPFIRPRKNKNSEDIKQFVFQDTQYFIESAKLNPHLIPVMLTLYNDPQMAGVRIRNSLNIYKNKIVSELSEQVAGQSPEMLNDLGELIVAMRLGLAFMSSNAHSWKISKMSTQDFAKAYKTLFSLLK